MRIVSDFISKNGPEFRALATGGLPSFLTALRPASDLKGVPAFCYHLAEPECFERDMLFLRENGYETISADDMLDYLGRRKDFSSKSVVLTFDDGAVNFYRVAFPLLKKYTQKAVLFIAPGLHRAAADEDASEERLCTWEELDEMHASGAVDIQSHTWAHRSMASWPEPIRLTGVRSACIADNPDKEYSMEDDLRMARESIEARFGKSVKHLAWPRYFAADDALRVARSVGYEGFWTGCVPRHPINIPGQSPFEIVRLSGEFLRRLPGTGRRSLMAIMGQRYSSALKKRWASIREHA